MVAGDREGLRIKGWFSNAKNLSGDIRLIID